MAVDPFKARFPEVDRGAGHYESYYLRAFEPGERLGVWIRHTVHKRPGAEPNGSVWFVLFDGSADGPRASKVTLPAPQTGDGDYIRVGESRLGPGEVIGRARTDQCDASWDLRYAPDGDPLFHLPNDWMYRAPIPRTKSLSPHPSISYEGTLTVDGREITLSGWPGMLGHNWGAEHAERWIWLHGLGFDGDDGAWLDATIGRVKLGPVTTPWIANGGISIDGERHVLGGLPRARRTEVRESPDHCEFVLPGADLTVQGEVSAPRKDFVGWVYADPEGPDHNTVNCSISDMKLTVSRPGDGSRMLQVAGGAAYELGMRERDHGIEIQPFPDG